MVGWGINLLAKLNSTIRRMRRVQMSKKATVSSRTPGVEAVVEELKTFSVKPTQKGQKEINFYQSSDLPLSRGD